MKYAEIDEQFNSDFVKLLTIATNYIFANNRKTTLLTISHLYCDGIPAGGGNLQKNVLCLKNNFIRYRIPFTVEVDLMFERCEKFASEHPDYCLTNSMNKKSSKQLYLFSPELYVNNY